MFGVPSTHTVVRVDDLCMTPVEAAAVYVVPRSEVANYCRFFARGRTEAKKNSVRVSLGLQSSSQNQKE